ncbi:glutamine amidotransferase-related protein [Hahella sp. NBU794]|uniref:glutamine amidotransferase-related protein n=1 Tax=Hahella sp. NBU794 TaxID=3422590 RepID=UPI003D6FF846
MRIGILQCDDVMEELQPEFGNYPAMFEAALGELAPQWTFVTYRAMDGELPDSVDACDGYITTGSRHGVNDGAQWIEKLESFVLAVATAEKKFVGICFGHQLLAKALGGQVEKSNRGWGVGMSFNQIGVRKNWMEPYQPSLDLVVSHQDQITQLPEGAEVLASSTFCPFYLLQYGADLMTVQGHPEFSKAYSSALMDKRTDRIPAPRIREGKTSLSAPVDDRLMMQWIINFFAGGRLTR